MNAFDNRGLVRLDHLTHAAYWNLLHRDARLVVWNHLDSSIAWVLFEYYRVFAIGDGLDGVRLSHDVDGLLGRQSYSWLHLCPHWLVGTLEDLEATSTVKILALNSLVNYIVNT